jgi:hypothetical protein
MPPDTAAVMIDLRDDIRPSVHKPDEEKYLG